jgi:hypothetical protein
MRAGFRYVAIVGRTSGRGPVTRDASQEMGEVSMPLEGLAMCVGFSVLLIIALAVVGYVSNSALRIANASSKQIRAVYREAESVRNSL